MSAAEQSKRSTWREYLEALLIAGLFLGFTNTFVIKTFFIPSGSMEDTLLVGDHLFVNRFIFGPAPTAFERALLPVREPRHGDIVIFRSPERPTVDLVKRLIGEPGDSIRVANHALYVGDERVQDGAYAVFKTRDAEGRPIPADLLRQYAHFGPRTVPAGEYFFMGDNRNNSYDSRFWGSVPRHFLKGRAFLIYWSFGGGTSDGTWHGWRRKVADIARTVSGFLTRTRWTRTLHLPR